MESLLIPHDDLVEIFSDEAEWYWNLVGYVEVETELTRISDAELESLQVEIPNGGYGTVYFTDKDDRIWVGELAGRKNPDGSRTYYLELLAR